MVYSLNKTLTPPRLWETKLFGVSSELSYSLNISMWLSHDCAVPVKKAWEEQGWVLLREELLWKPPCHWLAMCSACLQESVQLAGATHWAQQFQLWRISPLFFLLLSFTLITVWESSVSTTRASPTGDFKDSAFLRYIAASCQVSQLLSAPWSSGELKWRLCPACNLPSSPLSFSLSLSLSLVSLNQDIACPFLFIAASLPPVCSVPLFVCPRFILFGSSPSSLLPRGPHHPPFKTRSTRGCSFTFFLSNRLLFCHCFELMFAFLFHTVYSKTTSKDMQKRGQWGGWQQMNRQLRRRDEKETEIRGSGTPKCLLRGVVCYCLAAVRLCWMRAGHGSVCVWPWMEATFYLDSHKVISLKLLSCSPHIAWAEPPPRLISARAPSLKGSAFCFSTETFFFRLFKQN